MLLNQLLQQNRLFVWWTNLHLVQFWKTKCFQVHGPWCPDHGLYPWILLEDPLPHPVISRGSRSTLAIWSPIFWGSLYAVDAGKQTVECDWYWGWAACIWASRQTVHDAYLVQLILFALSLDVGTWRSRKLIYRKMVGMQRGGGTESADVSPVHSRVALDRSIITRRRRWW